MLTRVKGALGKKSVHSSALGTSSGDMVMDGGEVFITHCP